MQKRINICLIDGDKTIREQLEDYLLSRENFGLVGVAADGRDGARLLRCSDFDAAIISAILPYSDGITVVREYKSEIPSDNTVFVILIPPCQDTLTRSALDSGIDCSFLIPSCLEEFKNIFDKISELYYLKTLIIYPTLEEFSSELLHKLEISDNLKGHKYLKSAISKTVSNKNVTDGMTKVLYPGIAKENATTSSRVERNIRHAISESWKKDNNRFAELLCYETFRKTKPTNRDFILAAAEAYERLTMPTPD